MKVKIGKYPTWLTCDIHTNHMRKKYGFDWPAKRKWTKTDIFLEKVEDAVQEVYHVINRIFFRDQEQKVKVRIDHWDTYSMDYTLGFIVLPMLKQLKEQKQGAPHVDDPDVPVYLQSHRAEDKGDPDTGNVDSLWFRRWDYVLDEMIFAFETKVGIYTDWQDQFHTGEFDHYSVPVDADGNEVDDQDAVMYRFENGPNHTAEWDQEGHRQYQERITNGFRLFGKYYENLWS